MKGYRISLNIYAESEDEAKQAEKAIIDFISSHAQEGRAVSAQKIISALGSWQNNPFIKTQVISYFS